MRSFQCGQVRLIIRTPGQPNPKAKAKARAASSSGAASASSAAPDPVLPITAKHRPPVQPPAAGSDKSQFGVRPAFLPVIPPVFAKGQGPKGGGLPDPMPFGQLPRVDAVPDDDGGDDIVHIDDQPDTEEAPEECLEDDCPEYDPQDDHQNDPDDNVSKRSRRNPAPAK
jgi:hypothetical protein